MKINLEQQKRKSLEWNEQCSISYNQIIKISKSPVLDPQIYRLNTSIAITSTFFLNKFKR